MPNRGVVGLPPGASGAPPTIRGGLHTVPGLRSRTRVAANVLAIAERELALAPVQSEVEYRRLVALLGEEQVELPLERLTQELKDRVAAGAFDQDPERKALIAHLTQTATEKLKIANPRYLERVQAEDE